MKRHHAWLLALLALATSACAGLAPREMRRALVTAFGNARLDGRYRIEADDLPRPGGGKGRMGFLQ